MKLRAVIYARVSSQAQRERHTIENQLRVLPAFVASQGWELVATFVDDGRSAKAGKLEARDGFAALVRAAAERKFDILVVVDIDRLTRTDDAQERAAILGPFQRAGIQIATPSTGVLDLRTLMGELYVTMQALFAAEENRKRAERIKAGKLRAIAEGRKPAGPTPFGLAYDRATGRWSFDEAAAALVREIFVRVAAGESCVMIADDFIARGATPAPRTGWTRAAVYRIVRKRTAAGEWDADKARGATIRVPAIVTEAEWQAAARALLAHKRRGLRRTRHFYLLEGLMTCGHCGAPVVIRSSTLGRRGYRNPAAYVCRGRHRDHVCTAPVVRTAELDARVWAALCDELLQEDLVEALANVDRQRSLAEDAAAWQGDADTARTKLAQLEKAEGGIMARYRRGLVSDGALDTELAAIAKERTFTRQQLAGAERALGAAMSAAERQKAAGLTVERLLGALPKATPEQRRALLRELARTVTLKDGRAFLDLYLERTAAEASRVDAAGAAPAISVVMPSCYRTQHEQIAGLALRIRRVA